MNDVLKASDLVALLDKGVRLDDAALSRREIPHGLRRMIYDWINDRRALDTSERRIRDAANNEKVGDTP